MIRIEKNGLPWITFRHVQALAVFFAFLLVQTMLAAALAGAIDSLDGYTARFCVTLMVLLMGLPYVLAALFAPEGPTRETQRLIRNFFLMAALVGLVSLALTPVAV